MQAAVLCSYGKFLILTSGDYLSRPCGMAWHCCPDHPPPPPPPPSWDRCGEARQDLLDLGADRNCQLVPDAGQWHQNN